MESDGGGGMDLQYKLACRRQRMNFSLSSVCSEQLKALAWEEHTMRTHRVMYAPGTASCLDKYSCPSRRRLSIRTTVMVWSCRIPRQVNVTWGAVNYSGESRNAGEMRLPRHIATLGSFHTCSSFFGA
ncbi:hypothetical protein LY78DRAFT_120907 [Colletotrichum sublineola]|nr:hypothetical protein LY78DRAFT_120907 [Colletotrichum sublineola]